MSEDLDQYRKQGGSLYEYDERSKAYVHIYRNDRFSYKTKKELVEHYLSRQELDD